MKRRSAAARMLLACCACLWQFVMILVVIHPVLAEEGAASLFKAPWHYGAYLDLSYPVDFNFPESRRWRSKVTTQRVNEITPNMVLAYLRKDMSESSRWGMELAGQGGHDPDGQVSQGIPGRDRPLPGAETLKHLSRANVSYLAPVGTGLTLTAGLFGSLIGYESFYAKDNFNYTRTYLPDNSPYFMMGISAQYHLSEYVKQALYVINGYNYLSRPNDVPSYGTQVSWRPSARLTLTQNLYYGPDQSNTDLKFWRLFSDSIVEWKGDHLILAMSYDIGTEDAAERPGSPRTFWMGGALYTWWQITNHWGAGVRPEFYWDRNGRITGAEQFIKAITTTLEYKLFVASTLARWRLEYRYDDSTGQQSEFFKRGEVSSGVPGLAQGQHLLIAAILWNFDSQ